jgi:DNA-binding IclR family transcriptional regulator
MSRTLKILQVLRLYDEQRPVLRAAEIARHLGVSPATAYRCIRDLEQAGLLECIGGGLYVLGPAIVEMDRKVRIADPLIAAASDISRGLSERTRGTVLLCRLHGLKVLCVHSVAGTAAPRINDYERGRAMALYRGATSRAILAYLPATLLQRLIDEDSAGLRRAGWPAELPALQRRLEAHRKEGVQMSAGEVNPQARGWGVPLFVGQQLVGSLSVVREKVGTSAEDSVRIADLLRRSALRIQGRLEDMAARQSAPQ